MTHNEKLNAVLHILLNNQRLTLENKPIDRRMTFDFICRTVAEATEKWEVEFLRNILLNDGHIEMGKYGDGEPPNITHPGIKFIQDGGYRQLAEDREQDRLIKTETIKSLKSANKALWTSYISMVGTVGAAIISLIALLTTREQATTEEVNKLTQRIDTMTLELRQTQSTLDSVVSSATKSDTTPKTLRH